MSRNLVVCIDGTGNDETVPNDGRSATTNVRRFYEALAEDASQAIEYFPGVATTGWVLIDAKGQYTGFGAQRIRDRALDFLKSTYAESDRIFLFGFSRGAAIVRDLANEIYDSGFPATRLPNIRMLGLWDTVAAFGVPIDILGLPTQSINIGKKLDIPPNVQETVHLLAIDERRTPFTPTLIEAQDNVHEVWFSGVHADVGGGRIKRHLADITLLYMVKYSEARGLRFQEQAIAQITHGKTLDELMRDYAVEGELNIEESNQPKADRAIVVRMGNAVSDLEPKVHWTVLTRINERQDYDPTNLSALENRFEQVGN